MNSIVRLNETNNSHQETAGIQRNLEPWPDPVDGVSLLDDISAELNRYLSLPSGANEAITLWVPFTHSLDCWHASPRLYFTSAVPGCGKTTALSILRYLCLKAEPSSNITPAAVPRLIERDRPTLLIDEADTFVRHNRELQGVLNSGHTRGTASAIRCTGENHVPTRFSTWTPMAIAGIGAIHSTLASRSIVIPMTPALPGEVVAEFREDRVEALLVLHRKIVRWVRDNEAALRAADPQLPLGFANRLAANWRPLLAIADVVGGPWPEKVRSAATQIARHSGTDDGAPGLRLLQDIWSLFVAMDRDKLRSSEIQVLLASDLDSEWSEYRNGRPITKNQVAKLLGPFGLRPETIRIGNDANHRGYHRTDFERVLARYLPDLVAGDQCGGTADQSADVEGAGLQAAE